MIQVRPDGELPSIAVSWVNYTLHGKCKLTAYFLSSELNAVLSSFFLYMPQNTGTFR